MSRFTTARYDTPFKPSITIDGLMALSKEIETGFEELNLLQTLKANIERLDRGYTLVSSAEQLMVASTIKSVIGVKSDLTLSIENIHLSKQFDTTTSLEGVTSMIKTGFEWVVKKVKEFYAFLRNLIRKLFSNDEKKASEYKEGAKFDFTESKSKMDDALKSMRNSHQEQRQKMAKTFDDLERGKKSPEETREELNKIRDEFSDAFEKDAQSKKDLAQLLRAARFTVAGSTGANRESYSLGSSRRVPFTNAKEFVEFTNVAAKELPKQLRSLANYKLHVGTKPDLDQLKGSVKGIQTIRGLDKYFEETDEEGITFLAVKRIEGKPITVSNSDMVDILANCGDGLLEIKTVLSKLENTEKNINLTLRSEDNIDGELEQTLKVAKIWLRVVNSYTKTLIDTRSMITTIGDDALRVIDSLK